MLRRPLFCLASVVLVASAARAQPTLTATSDAHPGDAITWSVTGAAENSIVVVLASARNQGMQFGPIETHCGTIELSLGIGPGFRFVGRGRVGADGTLTSSLVTSTHLPARFDGTTIYAQAIEVSVSRTTQPQSCSITVTTSEVATTTLHAP